MTNLHSRLTQTGGEVGRYLKRDLVLRDFRRYSRGTA